MAQKRNQFIMEYPAVFEPNEQGGYNVSFPSFPGCVTFGKTFERAKDKAKEILELWLEELNENGEDIPIIRHRPIIDAVQVNLPTKYKIDYAVNYRQKADKNLAK